MPAEENKHYCGRERGPASGERGGKMYSWAVKVKKEVNWNEVPSPSVH